MKLQMLPAILLLTACATKPPSPYSAPSEERRNPEAAATRAREAADLLGSNPTKAKALLEEALTLDLFCGAAHNNLGLLHLREGHLYEAANEFEWARKLLPGNPDPRLNLALTLERAGDRTRALATLETALEVSPEHIPSMQAWAKASIARGLKGDKVRERLSMIALQGDSERWRSWAREQLLRMERERKPQEEGR